MLHAWISLKDLIKKKFQKLRYFHWFFWNIDVRENEHLFKIYYWSSDKYRIIHLLQILYDFDQNTFFSFLMFIMQQKTWHKPYLQNKDLWVLSPVYNSTTDIQMLVDH